MRPERGHRDRCASAPSHPDAGAEYAGGVHVIDLSAIRPMVAHPGDPDQGIPSDPTNGAYVDEIGDVPIDIAYAGSCTAGKIDDLLFYHQVAKEAVDAGLKVADGVRFFIQFGSQAVEDFCRENGLLDTFERAGATVLDPGCGACIGCGPGVSDAAAQVTVSAINRNYKGRSGPGSSGSLRRSPSLPPPSPAGSRRTSRGCSRRRNPAPGRGAQSAPSGRRTRPCGADCLVCPTLRADVTRVSPRILPCRAQARQPAPHRVGQTV